MDHACSKDKLAEMVVESLREETIEEGWAKTKDVNQILHCLVSTRNLLGRVAWDSGFQTDREIETSTCNRSTMPSRLGAGVNPLPLNALGQQSLGKSLLGPRPLLGPLPPRLLQPQHPRPLGLGLQRPVLPARSTPSPPKLRPLPKAHRPVRRLGSPLALESFRVHWCKCPPVMPPSPSHLHPYQ